MNDLLPREETLSITESLVRRVEALIAPDHARLMGAAKRLRESADALIVAKADDGRAILDDRKSILEDAELTLGVKKKTLHKCHKAVSEAQSEIEKTCNLAQRAVSSKLATWQAEQDRIRRAAEEAARKVAEAAAAKYREQEVERLAQLATESRASGDEQSAVWLEAEALERIDAPLDVQVAIIAEPEKVKNVRKSWRPVWTAENEPFIPRQFCDVSEAKLRDYAKQSGGKALSVNGRVLVEFQQIETAF